eukprot:UN07949
MFLGYRFLFVCCKSKKCLLGNVKHNVSKNGFLIQVITSLGIRLEVI